MKNNGINKFELALLLALCVTLCHGAVATARQTRLERGVVRLHVIAEDDSEAQQALKLRVRDRVLETLAPVLEGAGDPEEAEKWLIASLDAVKAAAEAEAGAPVSVEYGLAGYGTRVSEGCTLPAGEYKSLRVTIGSGSGHNWWGVIFPYFTELTEEREEQVKCLLGDKNFALISEDGGVTVKFRILELLKELRELWSR